VEALDIDEAFVVLRAQKYWMCAEDYNSGALRLLVRIPRLGFDVASAEEAMVLPASAYRLRRGSVHDYPSDTGAAL
jgi:hypothetical protein